MTLVETGSGTDQMEGVTWIVMPPEQKLRTRLYRNHDISKLKLNAQHLQGISTRGRTFIKASDLNKLLHPDPPISDIENDSKDMVLPEISSSEAAFLNRTNSDSELLNFGSVLPPFSNPLIAAATLANVSAPTRTTALSPAFDTSQEHASSATVTSTSLPDTTATNVVHTTSRPSEQNGAAVQPVDTALSLHDKAKVLTTYCD